MASLRPYSPAHSGGLNASLFGLPSKVKANCRLPLSLQLSARAFTVVVTGMLCSSQVHAAGRDAQATQAEVDSEQNLINEERRLLGEMAGDGIDIDIFDSGLVPTRHGRVRPGVTSAREGAASARQVSEHGTSNGWLTLDGNSSASSDTGVARWSYGKGQQKKKVKKASVTPLESFEGASKTVAQALQASLKPVEATTSGNAAVSETAVQVNEPTIQEYVLARAQEDGEAVASRIEGMAPSTVGVNSEAADTIKSEVQNQPGRNEFSGARALSRELGRLRAESIRYQQELAALQVARAYAANSRSVTKAARGGSAQSQRSQSGDARIRFDHTPVYSGPGRQYARLFHLNRGEQVQVEYYRGFWARAVVGDGSPVWIQSTDLLAD